MSIRSVYACLFLLAAGWLVPAGLAGQNPPALQPGDSLALAFEREVFAYPDYARRNPFKTLLSTDSGGPRFESLVLLGILYSPFAGESVALFAEGTRLIDAAGTVTVDLTGGTYRVREGATVGNVTVRTIERQQVTIELQEFGLTELRIMQLSRAASGGGPK